jgi:hypothetical protein
VGIAVITAALVILLSAFNGIEKMVDQKNQKPSWIMK